MNLEFEQIKSITQGAVRIEESDEGIRFYRFTKEQEELYKNYDNGFYNKTFSCPGVKFVFKTDSKKLFLKFELKKSSTRTYFAFDVYINGKFSDSMDNFSDEPVQEMYPFKEYKLGEFSKEFSLGNGEKEVVVYFPFSVVSVLKEMHVDEGAYVEAVKRDKKIIMFGDSITHGYDSMHTSNSYAARLADAIGAEAINKGIGGEVFFPPLARTKDGFVPEYITVAYGTNDWYKITDVDSFKKNCKEFFEALSGNYPETKIFAITPIWRKNYEDERPMGEFKGVGEYIKNVATELENVICIPGFELIPHEEKYFGDLCLHPNDEGFEYYFKNLYEKMKEYIEQSGFAATAP